MEPQVEQWVAWGNIHLIDLTSFWTILIIYYRFSHVLSRKSSRSAKSSNTEVVAEIPSGPEGGLWKLPDQRPGLPGKEMSLLRCPFLLV